MRTVVFVLSVMFTIAVIGVGLMAASAVITEDGAPVGETLLGLVLIVGVMTTMLTANTILYFVPAKN